MINKIKNISSRVLLAAKTYPFVLLMSLTTAVLLIALVEFDHQLDEYIVAKLAICSSLGIAVLFSTKMLGQRVGKELLWNFLGIILLIGFYFILPSNKDDFDEVYVFVLVPTVILVHLFVSFSAYIAPSSEVSFWQYNKSLFINFILSGIFTGVLTLGVVLALLAVDNLFNIKISDHLYGDTSIFLGVFGNTVIFLLFSGAGLFHLEKITPYPTVLKFFTQFILIPLLLLYVVILYFYSAKIVLAWELPQGWVSYLILAYAMLGILALLLVHPLKNDSTRSWVRIFSTIFYYSLIPLIILLFTAIFTRILEYGYTEPRYYVLLLALWLFTVQLYFIFYKKASIKFIPISLFTFGLFALLFPFLNSFSVAIRSQKNQLEHVLTSNQVLENGIINFDKSISSETVDNISDKFKFLSVRDQHEYLQQYLPDSIAVLEKDSDRMDVRSYFTNVEKNKQQDDQSLHLINSQKLNSIADYDYVILESKLEDGDFSVGGETIILNKKLYSDNWEYSISLKSGATANLRPLLEQLVKKYHNRSGSIKVPDLSIETDLGKFHIKIIFDSIERYSKNDNAPFYIENALVLIKVDE